MLEYLIGTKIGMTQVFQPNGRPIGVTAIEAGPCIVAQVKTEAKEGYNAIQLAFGAVKRITAAEKGHLKDIGQFKHLHEFRLIDPSKVKVGDKIDVTFLKPGDKVDIVGTSKGKGFAGVVKRHHFKGGPKTHGQSDRQRAPGAIGSTTTPGRVLKGTGMAGHLGMRQATSQRLEIIETDPARNLVMVKGAVPGAEGSLVTIKKVASAKPPPAPAKAAKG